MVSFWSHSCILSLISSQVFLLVICNLLLLCLAHLFAFSVLSLLCILISLISIIIFHFIYYLFISTFYHSVRCNFSFSFILFYVLFLVLVLCLFYWTVLFYCLFFSFVLSKQNWSLAWYLQSREPDSHITDNHVCDYSNGQSWHWQHWDSALFMSAEDFDRPLKFHPDDLMIAARISACLTDMSCWMKDHQLQLNLAKTELLVVSANPSLHHNFTFQLGTSTITPSKTARNLGVKIDDQLTFSDHMQICFI